MNLSLRNHTRKAAQLRVLTHCLEVAQGAQVQLECGEGHMKMLLVEWVTGWIRDDRLKGVTLRTNRGVHFYVFRLDPEQLGKLFHTRT